MRHTRAALALAGLLLLAVPLAAQDVLDRPPNLNAWVGIPWTVHVLLPHRFRDGGTEGVRGLTSTTTFTFALGLPRSSVAGIAYAMHSHTAPPEDDEVQPFVRHRLLDAQDDLADLALTAAWNTAAESFDAEALIARRFGPVRLLGAARFFSDFRGVRGTEGAFAAGAVWHPLPRSAPLALAADAAVPWDAEDLAWSAGIQLGIPHTAMTLSLQATNTAAATLQGASFSALRTHYGWEMTIPVPAGYFFGRYPDRDVAVEAVAGEPAEPADVVVEILRYAFGPMRVVVPAGSVVEWVNRDDVVHTATAEDDAWDSGAIPPGGSWAARFDRPGIYPYYCGPHPFMQGVVIVR